MSTLHFLRDRDFIYSWGIKGKVNIQLNFIISGLETSEIFSVCKKGKKIQRSNGNHNWILNITIVKNEKICKISSYHKEGKPLALQLKT